MAERYGASANDLYRSAAPRTDLPRLPRCPDDASLLPGPVPAPHPARTGSLLEDEVASPRLFVALVVVTLVAVLLGGLAVASLLRGPSDPPDAAAETPSSSTTRHGHALAKRLAVPAAEVDGDFRFLERVGGAPSDGTRATRSPTRSTPPAPRRRFGPISMRPSPG